MKLYRLFYNGAVRIGEVVGDRVVYALARVEIAHLGGIDNGVRVKR